MRLPAKTQAPSWGDTYARFSDGKGVVREEKENATHIDQQAIKHESSRILHAMYDSTRINADAVAHSYSLERFD